MKQNRNIIQQIPNKHAYFNNQHEFQFNIESPKLAFNRESKVLNIQQISGKQYFSPKGNFDFK